MFDERFVADLQRRYAGRPEWDWPDLLWVSTSPERAPQRAWMADALAAIAEPGRTKLRHHLQTESRFLDAYHELAVMAILRDARAPADYEVDLGGKTPDLFVPPGLIGPPLLVEVCTKNRSAEMKAATRRWSVLRKRV